MSITNPGTIACRSYLIDSKLHVFQRAEIAAESTSKFKMLLITKICVGHQRNVATITEVYLCQ